MAQSRSRFNRVAGGARFVTVAAVVFLIFCRKIFAATAVGTLLCGSFLVWSADSARADGQYQHTKDGKTVVWNDDPRPGDAATWNGDRDSDGYATGFGTLTWYTARQQNGKSNETLFAYYFGNMVRGKLNGPVNGHCKGITSHARFFQGKRMTRWAAGPIPSWLPGSKTERASSALAIATAEKKAKSAESISTAPRENESAATRPIPNYSAVRPEPIPAQQDVPAEGPTGVAKDSAVRGPLATPGETQPKPQINAVLRTLTGPPQALRAEATESTSGSNNPGYSGESTGPSAGPHLTKEGAVAVADAEAQRLGYDLSQYQRPDPQFDATDNTWSLIYDAMSGDGTAIPAKRFTVAIDDKTKRTAIVPRR